ncbi:unnamed protein product [Tenebrio molitor]|nr:unnamed protein product [Tenebrio molitor]
MELINLGFYSNAQNFWVDFTSRVNFPSARPPLTNFQLGNLLYKLISSTNLG